MMMFHGMRRSSTTRGGCCLKLVKQQKHVQQHQSLMMQSFQHSRSLCSSRKGQQPMNVEQPPEPDIAKAQTSMTAIAATQSLILLPVSLLVGA